MTIRLVASFCLACQLAVGCGPEELEELDLGSLQDELRGGIAMREDPRPAAEHAKARPVPKAPNKYELPQQSQACALHTLAAPDAAWGSSYSIASTAVLYVSLEVGAIAEGHYSATIVVNMPGGLPYQRFVVPFAVGLPSGAGEQQAAVDGGGYRIQIAMPVAGTLIEQRNLAGAWTAVASSSVGECPMAQTAFQLW